MKKTDNVVIILLFSAFLLLVGVGGWILKDREFSENENRVLQQMPKVTVQSVLSGDFEEAFQKYQDDQTPFRNQWITAKTAVKLGTFSRDINGVYLGREGWLMEKISPEDVDRKLYTENLKAISSFCAGLPGDITKSVILVPTKGAILDDKLPFKATVFDEKSLAEEAREAFAGVHYVDLYQVFERQKEQIYYKTDHHWTTEGAAAAYDAWRRQRGSGGFSLKRMKKQVLTEDFQGTLYSKVLWDDGTRDRITTYVRAGQRSCQVTADGKNIGAILQTAHLKGKDKYAVFFGGNYGELELTTGRKNGKNLLIIKDSFANCFAPFAAEDFEKVCMVDLRYFRGNLQRYMEENHITDLLILYSMAGMIEDRNISVLNNKGDVLS